MASDLVPVYFAGHENLAPVVAECILKARESTVQFESDRRRP